MNKLSTDIEELKKKFEVYVGDSMTWGGKESIWGFFAPHLSNKSELKKEAVREFVDDMKLVNEAEIDYPDKEQYSRGEIDDHISNYELGWIRHKLRIRRFLSSNEKEESENQ